MNLIKRALLEYDMELPEFARHIDIPKSTLQTWLDKMNNKEKIPRYAVVMLEALIEVQQLKRKDEAVKKVFELYGIAEKTLFRNPK